MDPLQIQSFSSTLSPFNPAIRRGFNDSQFLENAKKLAFQITGTFEGGKTDSLQLKDSGVISYGKHQANLTSGSLYKLIDYYTGISDSKPARDLCDYLDRLQIKDTSLKNDARFLNLLMQASSDPFMKTAQDKIFTDNYWLPAAKLANALGLKSEIGYAIFYDTNIQGGLNTVADRAFLKIKGPMTDEKNYLQNFLQSRREYILGVAAAKRKKGDTVSAKMLENSAKNRISRLEIMLGQHLP